MSLPTEIIDYTLGFLQSDTTTLKSCLQSHPILSQLAERHLYTNVTVGDEISPDQNDFCEALCDRPHIVNHVRVLEIKFYGKTILKVLSPILPKLSMLQKIAVTYTGRKPANALNVTLPKKFCKAFKECLRLPFLMDILIGDIAFPLSAFSRCKHIKTLSLYRWSHDGGSVDISTLPTIDSLALQASHEDSIFLLVNWIQSRNLSSLLYLDPSFGGILPQLLMSCSHSLIKLDFYILENYKTCYDFKRSTTNHSNDTIPILSSVLLNLDRLTITATLYYNALDRQLRSPIPAITELVRSASSIRVKLLLLEFFFAMDLAGDDQHHIADAICGPLHSLLVQSASTIGAIDLRVNVLQIEGPAYISQDVILSLFAGHSDLAQFVEGGRLVITPGIEDYPN